MGGTPLFALALVGMPIDQLPVETIRRILEGGESVCAQAGIPVAGGHTIDLGRADLRARRDRARRSGAHQAQSRARDRATALDPRQAARRRHLQRRAEEEDRLDARPLSRR